MLGPRERGSSKETESKESVLATRENKVLEYYLERVKSDQSLTGGGCVLGCH